jgi:AAA+ ATPase superfamily predicted ATPase
MEVIGRKEELELLKRVKENASSSFIAVYGRRRVGKTFLIRNAFDNNFDFSVTGLFKVSLAQQLVNFHAALLKHNSHAEVLEPAKDWFTAFQQLANLLESGRAGKKIIFLDELPWFDTPQSGFISALEHFWNSWASARTDIVLIVCGSAAGWMISKLINNKGGLHNRVTNRIRLEPFTLKECAEFSYNCIWLWEGYRFIWSR